MAADEDVDPGETREWLEALEAVLRADGPDRARDLLESLQGAARSAGVKTGGDLTTPYVNTIAPGDEPPVPGDPDLERRFRSLIRWNAIAIILQANQQADVGGHIASYQSAATLYEVGFNHFWRAPTDESRGDLIYIQGHSSPGIYARAYLEGRLTEDQLRNFRQEVEPGGLSSYPHPWLMPEFWQFPTVSMGLGSLMSIYQARFMKYLQGRGIIDSSDRTVWTFMGDGEMDEPESMGAISLAGRERLDNLVFVVNCNLQRLDGPVRGNGSIIQELETNFRGAGWNVIKVIWGSRWDPLLAHEHGDLLMRRMEEVVDGDYQIYKARDGAYVREHFFGAYPELADMVADLSDEEVWALNRGGHDAAKIHAAYAAAMAHTGQPTVILAKTIKGYGMGQATEGRNVSHQAKKMAEDALFTFRERFEIDLTDEEVREHSFHKPADDAPAIVHLRELREGLGGFLPQRRTDVEPLEVPDLNAFHIQLEGTGEREVSTTMAFVRILATVLRDKALRERVVPIVADESRTFGMEGMFRQLGIFSQMGQLYEPEDAQQLMFYKEDVKGQILQEGISEAGAFSSWLAAGTSYANHGITMLPFYVFYSMFGFQRIGDLAWAAGDSRARGFLMGGTAGRTTLNGEGLQHEDGHSHLLASAIPNCVAYDPCYAYELAVIMQDGLRRMVAREEDVFFYVTVMNENYSHPAMPEGAREGILRGLHPVRDADEPDVALLGAGTILNEVLAGADLLREDFGVEAGVWSVTSFSELARDGMAVSRRNRLHPLREPDVSWVGRCLGDHDGPVVAASDYVRAVGEQIRPYVLRDYTVLGTDGFGRSDTRGKLRGFFEVDRHHVALAALHALGRDEDAAQAIERYGIDADAEAPWRR
ncbi:MAG: pyruvate dehydrogenase (acetyl-transferring), homodimeric type [Solirubrobacteraceae bacterium MAG38_C4-C5]|nr:pyruvate dehydrogenase (acetyl-transferring), homodimeric type [Candidatus Siliceabacter maunaloa]